MYVRGKNAPWDKEAPIDFKYKLKQYPTLPSKKRVHPTQKQDKLIEELVVLHSFENSIIFDPFMGSGTTGVACKKLNRKFIGIEIEEKYFNSAKERIINV